MCTSRYCTNTLYASLQFTDLYTWVSYLIQDQPELMKCTKCFCWGRKKKKQLKMIFSVVILIWVLALDKNSRPPKTRRTVRTNLLAVIEQIRVTSITAAHLSALIPPSHFTPFHLPLHKLCWQQGLAARNDPLSRSQLVKALPDWRFDRCYHGSLTTEECDKPHLLACDWQSGISPLSQTKHRPPPFQNPAGCHSDGEATKCTPAFWISCLGGSHRGQILTWPRTETPEWPLRRQISRW